MFAVTAQAATEDAADEAELRSALASTTPTVITITQNIDVMATDGNITLGAAHTINTNGNNVIFNVTFLETLPLPDLTKQGEGTLRFNGALQHIRNIVIDGGTIEINATVANYTGNISVGDDGTLAFVRESSVYPFAGTLSGTGTVLQRGNLSTLTLSNNNSFNGTLTLEAGFLALGGNFTIEANGVVNVASGRTLTIAADRTLINNGTINNSGTITNNGTITNRGIFTGTVPSAGTLSGMSGAGANLTWGFSSGVLRISGTGAMGNWVSTVSLPWTARVIPTTEVRLPAGLTTIGNNAFRNMAALTRVNIPNGVLSIGSEAFRGCASLTSITIPNSVTSIGNDAFRETGLTSLVIPSNVTSIGTTIVQACNNLTEITFLGATPPTFTATTFNLSPADLTIFVPYGSLAEYEPAIGAQLGTRTLTESPFVVPPTGIPGITGYFFAMIAFLAISAALWGKILRRKLVKG